MELENILIPRPRGTNIVCSLLYVDVSFEFIDSCIQSGIFVELRMLEKTHAMGKGHGLKG